MLKSNKLKMFLLLLIINLIIFGLMLLSYSILHDKFPENFDSKIESVLSAFSSNGIGPNPEIDIGDQPIYEDGGTTDDYQGNHDIQIVDSNGNMFSAWVDAKDNYLYVQKLDPDGNHLWPSPVVISESIYYESAGNKIIGTKIFPDNASGATIIYSSTTNDIRAFRLDDDGNQVWDFGGSSTTEIMSIDTDTFDNMIDITSDNTGGLFVFERSGTGYVYQYLQNDGTFYSAPQTIDTTSGTGAAQGSIQDIQYDGTCTYFAYSKYLSSTRSYFYIQKYCLNVRQWTSPIMITDYGEYFSQLDMNLIPDNLGGVMVVYTEADRNNLLAQHYDSLGVSVWSPTIVNIQNQLSTQEFNPYLYFNGAWVYDNKFILDDSGNLVVVWASEHNHEVMQFYIQKININTGALSFPNNGKVLMDKYDYKGEMEPHFHVEKWDNNSFALIIEDRDRPYLKRRLAIHKFDMNGDGLWNQIFNYEVNYQLNFRDIEEMAKVAGVRNGKLYLSVLVDTLSGGINPDLYFLRIADSTMTPPIPTVTPTITDPPIDIPLYGKKLVSGSWFQATHDMKYVDDAGNFFTVWANDDDSLFYVQKYNINGDPLWTSPYVHDDTTDDAYFPGFDPRIIPDNEGGAMIVYEQGYADDVRAFALDETGQRKWPATSGISIGKGSIGMNEYVKTIPDNQGGIYIIRSDDNGTAPFHIYFQHLDKDGNFEFTDDLLIYTSTTATELFVDSITYDSVNNCVFGGIFDHGSTDSLYIQKICSGIQQWTMNGGNGLLVTNELYVEAANNSELYAVGDGGLVIFSQQQNSTTGYIKILAQRYDTSGNPVWDPTGINIQNKNEIDDFWPSLYQDEGRGNDQILMKVRDPITDDDELIILWTESSVDWFTTYMQRIRISDGALQLAEDGLPILYSGDYQDPGFFGFPEIFLWDDSSFIIVSDYATNGDWVETESFILARYDFYGNVLWDIKQYPEIGFTDWSHKTKVAGVFEDAYTKYFALEVVASNAGDDSDLDIYYMRLSEPTVDVICNTYTSSDVPKIISSSGSTTVTSTLSVPTAGAITDLNIVDLRGTHTYISDLDFTLTSPSSTSVTLIDETCGAEDDFYLDLDDEASSSTWTCPPTNQGKYRPLNALYTFDGEEGFGNWTLSVLDNWDDDGGTLDGWGLEICQVETAIPTPTITPTPSTTVGPTVTVIPTVSISPTPSVGPTTSITPTPSISISPTPTMSGTIIPTIKFPSITPTESNVFTSTETIVKNNTPLIIQILFSFLPLTGILLTAPVVVQFSTLINAANIGILKAVPYYIWKKVTKPWGIIIDEKTLKPIPFATVRSYKDSILVEQTVSDQIGRYAVAVNPGLYDFEIKHTDYKTFKHQINIENRQIAFDVFLTQNVDKIKSLELPENLTKQLNIINKIIYMSGFLISIFIFIKSQSLFNFSVLLIYFIFGALFIYRHFIRQTFNIKVLDEVGAPVVSAIIRLIDKDFNTLEAAISNLQGLYSYGKKKNEIAYISVYKLGLEMEGREIIDNKLFGKIMKVNQDNFLNNEFIIKLKKI